MISRTCKQHIIPKQIIQCSISNSYVANKNKGVQMKKYLILLLISILFASCSPSYQSILPKETQSLIPPNANKVILYSDFSSDSLFNEALNVLINENIRIVNENKELGYISTEGKHIGEGTLLRMNIRITKIKDVSTLSSSSEWMADAETMSTVNAIFGTSLQQEWKPASREDIGKTDYAYEKMIEIIQKIPHTKIEFVKE